MSCVCVCVPDKGRVAWLQSGPVHVSRTLQWGHRVCVHSTRGHYGQVKRLVNAHTDTPVPCLHGSSCRPNLQGGAPGQLH